MSARLCGWGVFKCHCVCNMRGVSVDERDRKELVRKSTLDIRRNSSKTVRNYDI